MPVDGFLLGLSIEEQDTLRMFADDDSLSFGETKVGVGDPIFSGALTGILKKALEKALAGLIIE